MDIPGGKFSNLNGFYQLSLYNGYVFVRKDLQIEGALGRIYNAIRNVMSFLGIDYPTLEYNLYSAGNFKSKNSTLHLDASSYFLARKPVGITFAGLVKGFYNTLNGKGKFNINGFTKLPFKVLEIKRKVELSPSE